MIIKGKKEQKCSKDIKVEAYSSDRQGLFYKV
jgi:hypothetical protein